MSAFKTLIDKPEEMRHQRKPRNGWEVNISMDLENRRFLMGRFKVMNLLFRMYT